MERIAKYIVIPLEIWQAADLSWIEKVLLAEIDSYTSKGRECYISNEYIAGFLQVSEDHAKRLVRSLIRKGYVRMTRFDGRKRFLESCIICQCRGGEIAPAEVAKNTTQRGQNCPPSIYSTNTTTKQFTIPSIEEVRAYCDERRNGIDAAAFIDYYTSNGWIVGRTKMKDWKAAVRNWERKEPKTKAPARSTSQVVTDVSQFWK